MRREREVGGNWEAALRLDHSRWHWRAWRAMPGSMFCAHRNLKGRDSLAAGEATCKCEKRHILRKGTRRARQHVSGIERVHTLASYILFHTVSLFHKNRQDWGREISAIVHSHPLTR